MLTVRRLYLIIVSAVGLAMLLGGLLVLVAASVEISLGAALFGPSLRETIATSAAVAAVGLAGWVLHWTILRRQAGRSPGERASPLRRLYVYGAALMLVMAVGIIGTGLCEKLLTWAEGSAIDLVGALSDSARLLIVVVFWLYHLWVADADRAAVGEQGASATLRRWYVYGVQFVALTVALFAARDIANTLVEMPGGVGRVAVAEAAARALVWLGIWLWHVRWTDARTLRQSDHGSTLRAVQAFLVLALAVVMVLLEANQMLYYVLARVLGVEAPGGVRVLDFASVGRPLTTVIVFGGAWALMRHRLRGDAVGAEPARQAAVGRLYEYLVALVAAIAFAAGLAQLTWSVLDHFLGVSSLEATGIADRVSLFLSMVVIAVPVWLLHWRAQVAPDERMALSRRLYLFATLAACVVGILVSGAAFIATLFNGLLAGELAALPARASRPVSGLAVAILVGGYHWRILRRDAALHAVEAVPPDAPDQEQLVVAIRGASEDEVRGALAALPPGATFAVRREAR